MTNLDLEGKKFTISLSGQPIVGTGERTVGMNDDELADYQYKYWKGTGKIVEKETGEELKFYFETNIRKSHTAGVAFKRDNYSKWDVSLSEFVFSTKFSETESSKPVTVADEKAWVDLLAQELWSQRGKFTTPALEVTFQPLSVNDLIAHGIIAEFGTNQIQLPITA